MRARDVDVSGMAKRYALWVEQVEEAFCDLLDATERQVEAERRRSVVLARTRRRVASTVAPLAPARFRRLRRKLLDNGHALPVAYQARRDMLIAAAKLEQVWLVELDGAASVSAADDRVAAARRASGVARRRLSVATGLPINAIRRWWS